MPTNLPVLRPNLGLYLDRTPLDTPVRAGQAGLNFRIKNGKISNVNLGWEQFHTFQLNGPVTFIDNFFPRNLDEQLLFGTLTDIYRFNVATSNVVFLTPRYETGTASTSGTAVTGIGTAWLANAKQGDQITFGTAGVTNPAATWFTIASVNTDLSITLTASAGVLGAAAYTIRRLFTGEIDNVWSFDTFVEDSVSGDDLWIGTNGLQAPVSWNGVTTSMTLETQLNFICKTLATYSNMMIYGNITQGGDVFPTSIINSDIGKPLDVVSGLASQFRIHDGTDEILNMVPLADNLALYSNRHIVQAQFVGDPLVFVFRSVISGLGPISHNGIADFGDFHEFVASDAQYVFDGVGVRETGAQVWREVIRQSDPKRQRRIFAHFDEENGDLIWSVPSTLDAGSGTETAPPEIAWVEHYLEDVGENVDSAYSKRQFPFTADGYYEQVVGLTWDTITGTWDEATFAWNDQSAAAGFPLNLMGDNNGRIWIINTVQRANGVLLPFFFRFGRQAMETGRERTLLSRVYPFAEQTNQTLNVRVLMSNHAAAPSTDMGNFPFETSLPEGQHFVTPYRRGRFVEIEFNNTGEPVTIWGYDLDWRRKGGTR